MYCLQSRRLGNANYKYRYVNTLKNTTSRFACNATIFKTVADAMIAESQFLARFPNNTTRIVKHDGTDLQKIEVNEDRSIEQNLASNGFTSDPSYESGKLLVYDASHFLVCHGTKSQVWLWLQSLAKEGIAA